jgi:hypothetical protein
LGEGIENYLCKWASTPSEKGYTLSKEGISSMKHASWQRRKGIVFQGSSGWYSRFLGRNPIVRNIVEGNRQKADSEGKYKTGRRKFKQLTLEI